MNFDRYLSSVENVITIVFFAALALLVARAIYNRWRGDRTDHREDIRSSYRGGGPF